jgi:hypothetical protein
MLIVSRDESNLISNPKSDYHINYDWVTSEVNMQVENPNLAGYRNKIYLGRSTSSMIIKYHLSAPKIIDLISYLGGVLKFLSIVKILKLFSDDFYHKKTVTELGYKYKYEKENIMEGLLFLDIKSSRVDKLKFNQNFNESRTKIENYSKEIQKNKNIDNEELISKDPEIINTEKNNWKQFVKKYLCCKKTHREKFQINDLNNCNKNYSFISNGRQVNKNNILREFNFTTWIKMVLCNRFKSERIKNFEDQLNDYKKIFGIEYFLYQFSMKDYLVHKNNNFYAYPYGSNYDTSI